MEMNYGLTDKIKSYLKRLNAGEDLESVRKDFVKNFRDVDASEIMKAEQELMREGTPITEVQKLCDVHSALFHGATREEKIANAEAAVEKSLKEKQQMREEAPAMKRQMPKEYVEKHEKAKVLRETVGHPLYAFTLENEQLDKLLDDTKEKIDFKQDVTKEVEELRQLAIHYAKKGDLIYPLLKVKYGIAGPSDIMWTVDDEIRDELALLSKKTEHDEKWLERVNDVIVRAKEMIYKEANILFPICAVNFTMDDWIQMYQDAKDYAICFQVQVTWDEAEHEIKRKEENVKISVDNEIRMPGGHLTVEQLTALLNTLPIEITFIDGEDINRYFNEGPKVFKRPQAAIDREVYSCHPPKIETMVRAILDDFKNNKKDSVPVWMEKNGKPFLVTYMAVRDRKGKYLGTVEVVQDMAFAKEHFLK